MQHPRRNTCTAVLVLAATSFGSACATARAAEDEGPQSGGASQLITREEIMASNARDGWEALRDLVKYVVWREDGGNGSLATRRGNTSAMGPENVRVILDGIELQVLNDLKLIAKRDLEQIRVLSAVDATTYFGTGSGSGAVIITTRR